MVAALTTSLPETPGGERNWDYRYTWIRDASFTLWSLHVIGFDQEAREFMEFVSHLCHGRGPRDADHVRDRGRDRAHRDARSITWTATSARSRSGSATPPTSSARTTSTGPSSTRSTFTPRPGRGCPRTMAPIVLEQAEAAAEAWRLPDQGIWEARGEPKHYVSSKLMCWVALDRAARLARDYQRGELADRWRAGGQGRSAPTSWSTGSAIGVCSASTTRPTRSTPRCS